MTWWADEDYDENGLFDTLEKRAQKMEDDARNLLLIGERFVDGNLRFVYKGINDNPDLDGDFVKYF
jgi:hypothetical protein